MTDIKSMTLGEISEALRAMGEPSFRGKQVFSWLHRGVTEFDQMINIPKSLREKLAREYVITAPTVARKQVSKLDGTIKYLWELSDGNCIETVLMSYHHGNTVCISSQVGCRMGCKFCASTLAGKVRDLTPSEMLDQVLFTQLDAGKEISNIVLMGIGEPLDNRANVMRFLELINHPDGMNIGMRHISLSTCGVVSGIDALAEDNLQLTLSVSLHAPDSETRSRIMPVNNAYDVSERTNNAVYMFETAHPTGFIRQRYRFLPESGYMDMAASYRDYLTAKYPNFAEQTVDADAPLSIELIGAIDKVQQVAGVPTSVPIAMTTYAEAKELLRELVTRNLAQNMSIRYAGWMNGGMNQQLLSSVRLIRQLGTQEELFSFAQNAAIAGVPLYLDGLTAFARDSGLLEGFIAFRDAARFTTREEAEIPEYSPIWYGANDDRDTYYLVKPAIAMRSVNTLVDAAASYGAGVSFRDIGYMLSADYDSKNHTTREAVLHQQAEKLAELKASGRDVMIRQGNDYAAVQATLITDMDFDGGQYSIIDEYVPFYPLALHSRVSYTGASLNLADDAEEVLLRSAEVGAGLQYTLTAQSARVLQDSTYSEFYGADASLVLDDITAQVAQYRQTLSGIFNQEMTGHERVGNVTITTYANGTRVYVNFGYTDAAVDGITVPARSYAAQQEVSK